MPNPGPCWGPRQWTHSSWGSRATVWPRDALKVPSGPHRQGWTPRETHLGTCGQGPAPASGSRQNLQWVQGHHFSFPKGRAMARAGSTSQPLPGLCCLPQPQWLQPRLHHKGPRGPTAKKAGCPGTQGPSSVGASRLEKHGPHPGTHWTEPWGGGDASTWVGRVWHDAWAHPTGPGARSLTCNPEQVGCVTQPSGVLGVHPIKDNRWRLGHDEIIPLLIL